MPYFQHLAPSSTSSSFKLLAGVFFAAFILIACGGANTTDTTATVAVAPTAGGDNSGDNNSSGDNSGGDNSGGDNSGGDNSGDNNSSGDSSGDNNSGGDNSGGDNSGGDNSGDNNSGGDNSGDNNSGGDNSGDNNSGGNETPDAITKSDCDAMSPAQYFNGTGCEDIIASCDGANEIVKNNACVAIMAVDCNASQFFNGSNCEPIKFSSACPAKNEGVNPATNECEVISSCPVGQVIVNNECAVASLACMSDEVVEAYECVVLRNPFVHSYFTDATNPLLDDTLYTNTDVKCGVQAIGTNATQFGTIENNVYSASKYEYSVADEDSPLALICASTAYARIANLMSSGNSNYTDVKQAGEGQTVAMLGTGFHTNHV